MIDCTYLVALSDFYPTVEVICFGDPNVYSNLLWVGGDPLPSQSELDVARLTHCKEAQIAMLSEECQQDIIGGFESSALGSPHWYDSEEVDQLNLIGAFAATAAATAELPDGGSIYYAVRPIVDGVKQPKIYTLHTRVQLKAVLNDGAVVKLAKLQKFNDKRNYIRTNITALEDVHTVTWTSVE